MVASDRPMAVSIFFETPMNGQRPRNCTNTKLLTRMALTRMRANSVMGRSGLAPSMNEGPIIVERVIAYKSSAPELVIPFGNKDC
ncbi:hypothetical protein D3C72_2150030 [compost metagenome]